MDYCVVQVFSGKLCGVETLLTRKKRAVVCLEAGARTPPLTLPSFVATAIFSSGLSTLCVVAKLHVLAIISCAHNVNPLSTLHRPAQHQESINQTSIQYSLPTRPFTDQCALICWFPKPSASSPRSHARALSYRGQISRPRYFAGRRFPSDERDGC